MAGGEPTNADILKAVSDMSDRVRTLENWKLQEDAYRAALARVKDEEAKERSNKLTTDEAKKRTELMKQAGIVLGLIIAILYAYMATKGIQP